MNKSKKTGCCSCGRLELDVFRVLDSWHGEGEILAFEREEKLSGQGGVEYDWSASARNSSAFADVGSREVKRVIVAKCSKSGRTTTSLCMASQSTILV
jgi:hypothetical protein